MAGDCPLSITPARRYREPPWATRSHPARVRYMQGMLSGGLLTAAFAAVAGFALLVLVRLFRIARPGGRKARAGG